MSLFLFNPEPPQPVVHLAIDPQTRFLAALRDPQRRQAFTWDLRSFADTLAGLGLPTVWLAFWNKDEALSTGLYRSLDGDDRWARNNFTPCVARTTLFHQAQLTDVEPKRSEIIIVKSEDDAFSCSCGLAELLCHWQTRDVLVSGMNTGSCVAATLHGALALKRGLRLWPVYNLMADATEAWAPRDPDPDAHRLFLEKEFQAEPAVRPLMRHEALRTFAPPKPASSTFTPR
jgi:nicotinamidase-related amidase